MNAWLEKRSGRYFITYRDAQRKTKRIKAYTDKRMSEQKLSRFIRERERGEEGLIDPYAEHKAKPLTEHVADYVRDLKALGRDPMYVYTAEKRLSKLLKACDWAKLTDITADSFARWRETPVVQKQAESEDRKIGPTTLNQYFETLRAFCRWCVKRKRIGANPVADVDKVSTVADVRRARRALSEEEIIRLVNAVDSRHRTLYRFILATGLRRQEAADLQWGDLLLGTERPIVQLRAKATKARRADSIPLRSDIAQELKVMKGEAAPADRVFASLPTMDEHRAYLVAAKIPWQDEQGRRADFHALRHTFNTQLLKSGTSLREAQELMRHTDPKLTAKAYTDPRIFDLAKAVERLPFPQVSDRPETAKATGTDGKAACQGSAADEVADRVAGSDSDQLPVAPTGRTEVKPDPTQTPDSVGNWQQKTPTGWGEGLVRHLGLEPKRPTSPRVPQPGCAV